MKKKILIVDDDEDFIHAIGGVLENAGYKYLGITSEAKAIETVQDMRPHLILLDAMMEDIASGFRFAHQLRRMEAIDGRKRIPILMISSFEKVTDLKLDSRIGTDLLPVDDFLNKPVEPETLVLRIENLIDET